MERNLIHINKSSLFSPRFDGNKFKQNSFYNKLIFSSSTQPKMQKKSFYIMNYS